MNSQFKIPLIVFLVVLLGLMSWQVARIFQKRSAEVKQAQQEAEQLAVAPAAVPDDSQTIPKQPLQKLEQPKTFTVNEIPDSAQGQSGKPSAGAAAPIPAPAAEPASANTPAIQTNSTSATASSTSTTAQPAALPPATPLPTPKAIANTAAATPVAQGNNQGIGEKQEASTPSPASAVSPAQPQPPAAAAKSPSAQPISSGSSVEATLVQAKSLAATDPVKARALAWSVLESPAVKEYDSTWVRAAFIVNDINRTVLTTATAFPEKQTYQVQAGDVLVRIAHKQKTTAQLLMQMNKIRDPRKIWVGQKLVFLSGDWSIRVSKSRFLLTLLRDGKVYRIYSVGIGRENRTPVGTFQIKDKVLNPSWDSPEGRIPPTDPRNILGTRWMGLEAIEETSPYLTGYGIHGTTLPETVGTPSSAGCVRLRNPDVEDLYNYIPEPASAKVKVSIFE